MDGFRNGQKSIRNTTGETTDRLPDNNEATLLVGRRPCATTTTTATNYHHPRPRPPPPPPPPPPRPPPPPSCRGLYLAYEFVGAAVEREPNMQCKSKLVNSRRKNRNTSSSKVYALNGVRKGNLIGRTARREGRREETRFANSQGRPREVPGEPVRSDPKGAAPRAQHHQLNYQRAFSHGYDENSELIVARSMFAKAVDSRTNELD
ncbi:hypothetical protein EAI_07881 [Harpegnathos saltator]|uniref:Uncharacterized protein n=1 Tax=Harpegnathos saltator TaxID=610380 RepID=E2BEB1_HARSA|nr:hypothetical protein EAI_07881 [Harpegnathos saltator]